MGKKQCCKEEVRREAWTDPENKLLRGYISTHGEGKWRSVPVKAGHLIISDSLYRLRRCGRSCSLRWFNYLKAGIKKGNITLEEEDLIIELHSKFGNRWSAIAARLAGRMDNEIKNYWNTVLKRKILSNGSKLQKTSEKKRAVTGHKFNANSCDAITLMDDSSSDKVTTGLFKFWERVLQHLEVDPGSSHTCSTTTSHKVSRKTSSTTNSKDESNWIVNEVRENEDIRV